MIYDLKETHKLEIQKQIINMYIKIIIYYVLTKSNDICYFYPDNDEWGIEGSYNHQTYFIAVAYMFDIKP